LNEAGFGAETTRGEALSRLVETFRRSELDEPQREARLTLCAAADLSPAALIASPETPLGALMVSSEGACAAYYQYGGVKHHEAAE